MKLKSTRSLWFTFVLVSSIIALVLLLQQSNLPSVKAQSSCTLAACTPTTPPCGLPGTPPCGGQPVIPTEPPTHTPRPTSTPTNTPTQTITPTPTSTITPISTSTLIPSPTSKSYPPMLKSIPNFIGRLHVPDNTVSLLPPWMQPDNIKITDLEITQAVQCLHNSNCADNSVSLYQGKATMVRAYVRLTTGPDSIVYPIGGALCYGNTGASGCLNPVRPLQKIFVENVPDPVISGRQVISTTLDFILPLSFVESGVTQTITVYANYNFEDLPQENYYKDNYKTLQYQVQPSQPIYVRFYPVQDNGYFTPAMEWATITDYLQRTYPTSEVYASLGFPLYGKNYAWTTPDSWGCPKGWHDLINDLYYMRSGFGPVAFGEVPYQALAGGVIGCGVLGGPEAAGLAGTNLDGRVAAQEIGHTMNLPHVPGCGAGGADINYPEPNGLLDEFGTDVSNLRVYPPSSSYDFMGYCGGGSNSWTSIYTYNEIAGLLPEGAFQPGYDTAATRSMIALTTPQFLLGSGEISPTSAKLTHGFYLLGRDSVNAPTPDNGPYTVELDNINGKLLYSQHFDLIQMSNANLQSQGGFQLVLPWTAGTHQVLFKYQGKIIGQVTASANPPRLKLTSPTGGEHWAASGQQTIQWTASDADGNPLSYLVQYSPDGGTTWEMMAANLTTSSFTFDAQYLPGSSQGLVRVVATDGMNTVQAISQPITVDPQAPLLSIASPQEGQSFDFGSPVVLRGFGADFKDGALSGDGLQWSSDKDGKLGTGNTLIDQKFSLGKHTLTLSAQNSSGLMGSVTVHITIIQPEESNPIPGNSVFMDSLVPVLILLVVAAVVLLVVFTVRRRRKPEAGS